MERKIDFYQLSVSVNKNVYTLKPFTVTSDSSNSNVTFYKKIKNTFSGNLPNAKRSNETVNIAQLSEHVKHAHLYKSHTLMSSVDNFKQLEPMLISLKPKSTNLLFRKLKTLKKQKKHIFFYLKHNNIFLSLNNHIFKHGLIILKSLVYNRIKTHEQNKYVRKFYRVLLAK